MRDLLELAPCSSPVFRREITLREIPLELVGGRLGLVELHVGAGNVPEFARGAAELECLREVANGVVVATFPERPHPLLVERPGALEVIRRGAVGKRSERGGNDRDACDRDEGPTDAHDGSRRIPPWVGSWPSLSARALR